MKTILMATDFSDAGRSASLYGIELARSFNARAILFSAYQPVPLPVSEVPVIIDSNGMRSTTEQQLASENSIINRSGSVDVETVGVEGAAVEAILNAAREKNADMIVVGMKADHKGLRRLFGSVVITLVRRTEIPLLVVPETVRYTRIATLALATDSDLDPDSDSHLLDTLRELGERYHSKVYLVRVATSKFHSFHEVLNPVPRICKAMQPVSAEYQTIENKDIIEGLRQFITAYKINMLALLPHKQSRLERWFYRSITREMVFETQVPLLILPERSAK